MSMPFLAQSLLSDEMLPASVVLPLLTQHVTAWLNEAVLGTSIRVRPTSIGRLRLRQPLSCRGDYAARRASSSIIGSAPRSYSRSSASTTRGENCVPEQARISATALSTERGRRYGRSLVIASKASATVTIVVGSGNLLAGEPVRVAGAVPALVMVMRDRGGQLEARPLGEELAAPNGVLLHQLPLLVSHPAGVGKDRIRHVDLADVVERGCQAQLLGVRLIITELAAEQLGGGADIAQVATGRVIVRFCGGGKQHDRLLMGLPEVGRGGWSSSTNVAMRTIAVTWVATAARNCASCGPKAASRLLATPSDPTS